MGIETLVKESERLSKVFGYWPSFHDAEIIWLRLDRGDRSVKGFTGANMEMMVHVFEITNEVAPTGLLVLKNHVLVHFRFLNTTNLKLENFTHQNVLMGLGLLDIRQDQLENINFEQRLDCLNGGFRCKAVEILAVTPCDNDGRVGQRL